jgi:benzil reductase ((S)-benzoin forming)
MQNGFFLITGTSRGIGEALAREILQHGHTVLGVARSRSDALESPQYHHVAVDLADTSGVSAIMAQVDAITDQTDFARVGLIHNASAVEPAVPIDRAAPEDIETHVKIGLVTPMILTSQFIRKFADAPVQKRIAFVSSGAAVTPLLDGSVYSGTKAGINMFARGVGLEQQRREHGFEVVVIGPGMVDTAMQLAVRSKSPDEFALAGFFKQAYEDGKLQDPAAVAAKIYIALGNTYEPGEFVSISDLTTPD